MMALAGAVNSATPLDPLVASASPASLSWTAFGPIFQSDATTLSVTGGSGSYSTTWQSASPDYIGADFGAAPSVTFLSNANVATGVIAFVTDTVTGATTYSNNVSIG